MQLGSIWTSLADRSHWRLLWLRHAKFSVGVTGIVFDAEGRVLLLEHTFRRRYPWGLLSGWVKRGESLEAALHREAAEETTLAITIDRVLRVRRDRFGSMIEVVYLGRLRGGTFRPSAEITAAQWRRPDDLPAGLHPHHVPLIREAAAAWARQSAMARGALP